MSVLLNSFYPFTQGGKIELDWEFNEEGEINVKANVIPETNVWKEWYKIYTDEKMTDISKNEMIEKTFEKYTISKDSTIKSVTEPQYTINEKTMNLPIEKLIDLRIGKINQKKIEEYHEKIETIKRNNTEYTEPLQYFEYIYENYYQSYANSSFPKITDVNKQLDRKVNFETKIPSTIETFSLFFEGSLDKTKINEFKEQPEIEVWIDKINKQFIVNGVNEVKMSDLVLYFPKRQQIKTYYDNKIREIQEDWNKDIKIFEEITNNMQTIINAKQPDELLDTGIDDYFEILIIELTNELSQQIYESRENNQKKNSKLDELRDKLSNLTNQINETNNTIKNRQFSLEVGAKRIETLEEQLKASKKENEELTQENEKQKQEINQKSKDMIAFTEKKMRDIAELEEEIAGLKEELEKLEKVKSKLENRKMNFAKRLALQNAQNAGAWNTSLFQAKDNLNIDIKPKIINDYYTLKKEYEFFTNMQRTYNDIKARRQLLEV